MSEHFRRDHRKARKPHTCSMCARRIQPGETYLNGAGMDGGAAWSWKECAHCDALLEYARTMDDWEYYGPDTIVDWTPETMQQARVKAQWTRKWQRGNGDLFPVPRVLVGRHRYTGRPIPADIITGTEVAHD